MHKLNIISLSCILLSLSACNPFYVMRAAYEESVILLNREDIPDVIQDEETTPEEREKLQIVLDAREFAKSIGLKPKDSFTKYTRVNQDILVWVLLGAKPDAFALHTWWYPIVGRIPYHGYFDKEDAIDAAKELEEDGFETWVRGSEAFSTLGWFNDPVLSTTIRHHKTRVANTVLHETFHSTVWIPGHVDFNESMANFVGFRASVDFFEDRASSCEEQSCEEARKLLQTAQERLVQEIELADTVTTVYDNLAKLYESERSRKEKIKERDVVFEAAMAPLREKYPKLRILKSLNNAEVMQLKLYLTKLDLFQDVFKACGSSWNTFIDAAKAVKEQIEDDSEKNPFEEIEQYKNKNCPGNNNS